MTDLDKPGQGKMLEIMGGDLDKPESPVWDAAPQGEWHLDYGSPVRHERYVLSSSWPQTELLLGHS